MSEIILVDLEKEVGSYNYKTLKGTERADRCITKAVIWLTTRYLFCSRDPVKIDYENKTIKEIIAKRACYELYSMGDQEEKALDKKEDALELLAGILGDRVYQSTFTQPEGVKPVPIQSAAVIQKQSWWDNYGR